MLLDQSIWQRSTLRAEIPGQLSLKDDEVLIVAFELSDVPSDHHAQSMLDPYELSRAQAFHHDIDRMRYIAAHGALRQILALVLDGNPRDIEFGRGKHGKPFIRRGVKIPGYFNLSHTNQVALVAVSTNDEVGIDIETTHALPDAAAIAALQFSARENSTIEGLPEHEKVTGFYHCWTQRESVLKLFGWGLVAAPVGIEVEANPRNAPCVFALPSPGVPPRIYALPGIHKHMGCVAVSPGVKRILHQRW
jgi:4'-phosphopantetheinyl transferase